MGSRYKDKDGGVVLSFNGTWVSWSHTVVAYSMCSLLNPALTSLKFQQLAAVF